MNKGGPNANRSTSRRGELFALFECPHRAPLLGRGNQRRRLFDHRRLRGYRPRSPPNRHARLDRHLLARPCHGVQRSRYDHRDTDHLHTWLHPPINQRTRRPRQRLPSTGSKRSPMRSLVSAPKVSGTISMRPKRVNSPVLGVFKRWTPALCMSMRRSGLRATATPTTKTSSLPSSARRAAKGSIPRHMDRSLHRMTPRFYRNLLAPFDV